MFNQLAIITLSAIAVIWMPTQSPLVQQPIAAPPSNALQKPAPPTPDNIDAVIEDINGLRRQFGGGVARQLEGLYPQNDDSAKLLQQEFNAELSRLAREPVKLQNQQTPALVATPRPPTQRDFTPGSRPPSMMPQPLLPAPTISPQVRTLRHAARRLEELAAQFEENNLYREADELRAQATQFWRRARNSASSHTQR